VPLGIQQISEQNWSKRMFNIRPNANLLEFGRVPQDEPSGFRMGEDGSMLSDARSALGAKPVSYGPGISSAPPFQQIDPLTGFGMTLREPGTEAILTAPSSGQPFTDPSTQQFATAQNCRAGYEACMRNGRPRITCLQLMYNCSQNGVPTIFAPGIWGKPG
jgi:hypothetical protein